MKRIALSSHRRLLFCFAACIRLVVITQQSLLSYRDHVSTYRLSKCPISIRNGRVRSMEHVAKRKDSIKRPPAPHQLGRRTQSA